MPVFDEVQLVAGFISPPSRSVLKRGVPWLAASTREEPNLKCAASNLHSWAWVARSDGLVYLAADPLHELLLEQSMPECLDFDAVIVGGGPAGLAAAVNLARALRSVLVCDRPQPGRSDYPQVNHNYLGFPEGVAARELRARGTAQAERYGAQVCRSEVVAIRRTPDGFALEGSGGEHYRARGVILATGVRDNWTRFPGFEAFIGRSLHWCIVCDGYEMRGKRVVVAGTTMRRPRWRCSCAASHRT